MVPLKSNTNQAGCTPVSTNCVIWQGPDIPCIQLCKGDSISDVTAKLAQQLCDLLSQVQISNFSNALLCFQPLCPPIDNLEDLINFIINELCTLQACCAANSKPPTPGCPDCLVTVAPCFQTTNALGDVITQMQLVDYARAIGVQVCDILSTLAANNTTLTDHGARLSNLESQLPPTLPALPLIPSSCLLPDSTDVFNAVTVLNNEFCALIQATGNNSDIFASISTPCANLNQAPSLANPNTTMGTIPGWNLSVVDLSDSINNIWLTLCDLRAAVGNLADCCEPGCSSLDVSFTATITGRVITISFAGSVPTGFVDCYNTGNPLTVTDIYGNQESFNVPVLINITNNTTVQITLTNLLVDVTTNLTLALGGCWNRDQPQTTCERDLTYVIVNSITCPDPEFPTTNTTIGFSFTNQIAPPVTYYIQLFQNDGVTPVAGANFTFHPATIGTVVSGTFTGLTPDTFYKVGIRVTLGPVDNSANPYCQLITIPTEPGEEEGLWLDGYGGYYLQSDDSRWLISS